MRLACRAWNYHLPGYSLSYQVCTDSIHTKDDHVLHHKNLKFVEA
jgi:hypothetical protein